jgi:PST family polysaccharide transporter/lipopolysaccharide exporter
MAADLLERESLGNPLTHPAQYAAAVLKGMWRDDGTLGQKTVRGGLWNFGSTLARKGLGIVQYMVLARLLLNADFGLMALAGSVMELLDGLTDVAVGAALIQGKDTSRETLDTVWSVQVSRNFFLFAVIFLAAPYVTEFYRSSAAADELARIALITPILRLIGLRFLVGGVTSVGIHLLRKELDFKRVETLGIITQTISFMTTIVCGVLLRNVWALVIGQLVQQTVYTAGSYVVHPYRPAFRIQRDRAWNLIRFGANLTASGVLFLITCNAPNFVLPKILNFDQLGLFFLAFLLSNLPVSYLSNVIKGVIGSTYAKLQGDPERLRKVFYTVVELVAALAIPASLGMCLLAQSFVGLVWGAEKLPMVACFQVLTLYGALNALAESCEPFFIYTGRLRLRLGMHVVRLALLAALIYPMTRSGGIVGAGMASVISIAGCALWSYWMVARVFGGAALWKWLRTVGRILVCCAGMAAVTEALVLAGVCKQGAGLIGKLPLGFAATALAGAGTYFVLLYFVSPGTVSGMRRLASKAAA